MPLKRVDAGRDIWRRQFGGRVRNLRKSLNLTQTEFAARLGYASPGWASDLEIGADGIDAYDLFRLCAAFDADPNYLLTGTYEAKLPSLLRAAADQLDSNLQGEEECPKRA